jgi:hypothetical protein
VLVIPKDILVYTPAEIDDWKDVPEAFVTQVIKKGVVVYDKDYDVILSRPGVRKAAGILLLHKIRSAIQKRYFRTSSAFMHSRLLKNTSRHILFILNRISLKHTPF